MLEDAPHQPLLDRLFRLGVPLLVFLFVLHPLLIKILKPELANKNGNRWMFLILAINEKLKKH